MERQVSKRKRRLAEEDGETVREDYVKKMRDSYPLIIRTLMQDLIVSIDKDGDIVFLNDAAVEFWGKPSEEIIGTHFSNYLYPEDVEKLENNLQEMIKSKHQIKGFIITLKTPRGVKKVAWNAQAVFDDEGNYIGAQATGKDLTELLRTEEELKWSQRHLQRLFEVLVDPVVIVDMNGNILEFSQSAEEILGFPREELVGKHYLETDAVTDKSKAMIMKNLEKMKKGKYVSPFNVEAVTKDGEKLLYELTPAKLMYNGEPAILGIFHNITEQRKVEEKLRASEERFKYFIENAPEAIWVQDVNGIFIDGNKRSEELTGYKNEELIGKNMLDILVSPESVPRLLEAFKPDKLEEISGPNELELIKKDGSTVIVEASTIPVERDGKIEIIGLARDVTSRQKAEEALRESEMQFRELIELLPTVVFEADTTGKLTLVNNAAFDLFGYSQQDFDKGLNAFQMLVPEQRDRAKKNIGEIASRKTVGPTEYTALRKDGSTFPVLIHSSPIIRGDNVVGLRGIIVDITERKKSENALKESEERFRQLVEFAPEAIYVNDLDGTFIDGNRQAEEMIGCKREEVIGKNMLDLNMFPEEYLPQVIEGMEINKRGEKTGPEELEVIRRDGSRIFVENTSIPVEREGKIEVISIARDITERKKMENALKESEERFRTIFEGATDGIAAVDPKTMKIVFANPKVSEILGYPLDELLNSTVIDFVPKNELSLIIQQFQNHVGGKTDVTRYIPIVRKDKTLVYGDIRSKFMNIGDQQYLMAFLRDVTEQKKAEEALRRSEEDAKRLLEFQKKAIDTATVWVNLVDSQGNVILWNRAAEAISGYSHEEMIGHKKMWKRLYPDPEHRAKLFAIGKEILTREKRLEDFESTIRCKDGSMKNISWYSTVVMDEKGKPAASIAVGIDITDRKRAEEAIKEANRLLKKSNEELESYTYVVSHDLKAPLRTIKSFGSFLLEDYGDKLDETGQDYLYRMVNASSRMDSMIESLLVLSRVGRQFNEIEKVDLNKLLEEILADLEATIKERNAEVVVDKLPTLSVRRVWKRQLFMNLISNALKFNESKTPKIEVLYEARENGHLFKVRDNGIGIEKKYLDRIFNLFERGTTKKTYEGTGAGLAICKKIVEHLGGKIWVESTPGKGSTFLFTIPKEVKQAEET